MFKFLILIGLLLLVLPILFGVTLLQAIMRGAFGGKSKQTSRRTQQTTTRQTTTQRRTTTQTQPEAKEKIINDTEGEYVDYEEVS
ncbi:hypothetical protein AGMMS49965_06800 [Bacteroidia bacterium]|nr:hypothetical protein AGMMS49965_06800 [Bacteroidia bacterium]